MLRTRRAVGLAAVAALAVLVPGAVAAAQDVPAAGAATATPIRHLVVIFQENVSFDHYFGTYPRAANTSGQPFRGDRWTPDVNGLRAKGLGGQGTLLTNNPN